MNVSRPELQRYASTLSTDMRLVLYQIEQFVKESSDTLNEDFQLAADLLSVFERRSIKHNNTCPECGKPISECPTHDILNRMKRNIKK